VTDEQHRTRNLTVIDRLLNNLVHHPERGRASHFLGGNLGG
jgi:hypothetical protein